MPAGAALAFAAVLAADRRRWAGELTVHSWTDDLAETRRAADALTRAGITVSVEVDDVAWPALRYVNRDRRRVARVLRRIGLPPPRSRS